MHGPVLRLGGRHRRPDGLDAAFGTGRTGLIGVNGSGKSTLLKLAAGWTSASGTITVEGEVGYLPQTLVLDGAATVADLLGITATRTALHAIERGEATEENFTAVGDDWDVEERARAELDRLGLDHVGLDRTVPTLSGGEAVMVRLAARFLARPDVLLLDEPTNNLDLDARHRLYDAVASWTGVLVVVSHDRELLDRVDEIADLRDGTVRTFGGNLSDYEELLAVEKEAAERTVRSAETDLRRQKRELEEAHVKLARRRRYGDKMFETKREPKIIMQERKRQAQVSASKHRIMHEERSPTPAPGSPRRRTRSATTPDPRQAARHPRPGHRTVATVTGLTAPEPETGTLTELIVRGPERIALTGPNGSGKTTFLRALIGERVPEGATVKIGVDGVRYLPQRLDVLDEELSVIDNVRAQAPSARVQDIRAASALPLSRRPRRTKPACCRAGKGSAPSSRPSCSPSPPRSCSCWTSRRTTSTWPVPHNWPKP